MSPGATWEPFEISPTEYETLLPKVLHPDRSALEPATRYSWQEFTLDPEFDGCGEHFSWVRQVCEKHRAAYQEKLKRIRPAEDEDP